MLFERYGFVPQLEANLSQAGFRRPTDIQFRAIPPILAGNDLLAIAQTGTGKTMAFAIPMVEILARKGRDAIPYQPRGVVLVPTHELAQQIYRVYEGLTEATGLIPACVIGGSSVEEQIRAISPRVEIVVATPGRMHDLARNRLLDLSRVRMLVLDEADRMLSLGFQPDITRILRYMPRSRQTLFFSATISPQIKKLAYRLVVNPIRIEIAPDDPVSRNIDHSLMEVAQDDKRFFLERLVRERPDDKILVFVRTQVRAARVARAMERVGIEADVLHGGLERAERRQALGRFARGDVRLLIATDVSARGLDIPGVTFVVNYDMPIDPEVYVHRIGRTGRGCNRGVALSFCSADEEPLRRRIESLLGHFLPVVDVSYDDYETTIDFSAAAESDWKTLIRRHHEAEAKQNKRKKR